MNGSTETFTNEETAEFMSINDLGPNDQGINVKFKCLSKNKERIVRSKRNGRNLQVAEALVGDNTASILLTLWNEDIERVKVDSTYQLVNGYISIFRGSLRLNKGRYGHLEEIEEEFEEINEGKNLSKLIFESPKKSRRKQTPYQKRRASPFKGYFRRY